MKAIIVREFGEPDVMKYEETATPEPAADQVLVRIKAAGVNPVDTYIRAGLYAAKPQIPFTPGKDASGIIERAGERAANFNAGDRVFLAGAISGTYAEFAVCAESQVHLLPENISFEQGAGVFVPYATSYRALFQKAAAKPGETVLIHGASGGVGVASIQWAKNSGLRVFATAGSEDGKRLAGEQGADQVFDHSQENYLAEIKEAAGGGVPIILEMLANVNLSNDLELLGMFGRIVVIGNRGSLDFDPRAAMGKDAAIFGMSLFNAPEAEMREINLAIFKGLSEGFLVPVVGRKFPLSEAAEAHRTVIENKAYGKIVLVP